LLLRPAYWLPLCKRCELHTVRRALDPRDELCGSQREQLLRYAGEVAVERGGDNVTEFDVREAQRRLESDKIAETIKTLPYHQRLVLYVIASNDATEIGTNKIYEHYLAMCEDLRTTSLSKARISSRISELDMLGLISARKLYKGRYGRTRLVASNVSKEYALLYDRD